MQEEAHVGRGHVVVHRIRRHEQQRVVVDPQQVVGRRVHVSQLERELFVDLLVRLPPLQRQLQHARHRNGKRTPAVLARRGGGGKWNVRWCALEVGCVVSGTGSSGQLCAPPQHCTQRAAPANASPQHTHAGRAPAPSAHTEPSPGAMTPGGATAHRTHGVGRGPTTQSWRRCGPARQLHAAAYTYGTIQGRGGGAKADGCITRAPAQPDARTRSCSARFHHSVGSAPYTFTTLCSTPHRVPLQKP